MDEGQPCRGWPFYFDRMTAFFRREEIKKGVSSFWALPFLSDVLLRRA
ncbi:hypothetical protein SACS_0500 [Parasaccharibacter apium]|uniref:Uncharacterized protein n=1 Tax=Parasaccharibacter apium TaxID=1510841 RepID=A0A7U7G4Y8_9PROT|nr:hypothetical protein SACS_0500 [Parasaccharibacter apium]